jgi:hypothetical protein
VRGRLARDVRDRLAGLEHGIGVRVEVEMGLRVVGIAPRDRENLLPAPPR